MRTLTGNELIAREGLHKVIFEYDDKMTKWYTDLIAGSETTREAYILSTTSGDLGLAGVVNENKAIQYDDFATPFQQRVYVLMRALGFACSKQAKFTDLYSLVNKRAVLMAQSLNQTKETVVANIINLATSSTYTPDGIVLAATTHKLRDTTASNLETAATPAPASVATMYQNYMNVLSYRGNVHAIPPPYMIWTGPTNMDLFERIVGSDKLQGTANNDKNSISGVISKVHVNPYITSTKAWGMIAKEYNEIRLLNRIPRFVEMEYDMDHQGYKFVSGEEYAAFVENWRFFRYNAGL